MIHSTWPTPNFPYSIWTDTFRISMDTTEEQYLSGDDSSSAMSGHLTFPDFRDTWIRRTG